MSYGSIQGVARLARRWADSTTGTFSATTNPTAVEVGTWLREIDALLDAQLAERGFTVPVDESRSVTLLGMFANELAAARVEAVHGATRINDDDSTEVGFMAAWARDALAFISSNTEAFVAFGVARSAENRHSYFKMTTIGV